MILKIYKFLKFRCIVVRELWDVVCKNEKENKDKVGVWRLER